MKKTLLLLSIVNLILLSGFIWFRTHNKPIQTKHLMATHAWANSNLDFFIHALQQEQLRNCRRKKLKPDLSTYPFTDSLIIEINHANFHDKEALEEFGNNLVERVMSREDSLWRSEKIRRETKRTDREIEHKIQSFTKMVTPLFQVEQDDIFTPSMLKSQYHLATRLTKTRILEDWSYICAYKGCFGGYVFPILIPDKWQYQKGDTLTAKLYIANSSSSNSYYDFNLDHIFINGKRIDNPLQERVIDCAIPADTLGTHKIELIGVFITENSNLPIYDTLYYQYTVHP